MKTRIDYIDLIKGITIFGVVWVHTACYTWLSPILVNSIFFFLSGIFFRRMCFSEFLKTKVQTMLIPFVFFYILSYPFRLVVHYWDNRTFANFDWGCILDVFDISAQTDYLSVNVPLWFLLCLFIIQVIYYFISYMDKKLIFVVAISCFVFRNFFYSIPAPFMANAAFYYMGFFALGNLFGKSWIEKLSDTCFQHIALLLSVLLFAFVICVNVDSMSEYMQQQVKHVKLFMVFFAFMSIASLFNGNRYLGLLRFFGENSLIILGLHVLPLIIIRRISFKLFGDPTPMMGFVHSIICMVIMYLVILFCNNYIPRLVGRKK